MTNIFVASQCQFYQEMFWHFRDTLSIRHHWLRPRHKTPIDEVYQAYLRRKIIFGRELTQSESDDILIEPIDPK